MMKAIRITKDNKKKLEQDYDMDPGELELNSGMWLVTDFGSKQYSILTPARFAIYYDNIKGIGNGYVQVTPKPASLTL
jgi:hypothetical protein